MRKIVTVPFEVQVKLYEPLLRKIAVNFGFIGNELGGIVEDLIAQAGKQGKQPDNNLSLKLWLSKLIVRQCVYKISSQLFSQKAAIDVKLVVNLWEDKQFVYAAAFPLHLWTVYVLKYQIGFSDSDISFILNSDLFQIKKRLLQATVFMAHHKNIQKHDSH